MLKIDIFYKISNVAACAVKVTAAQASRRILGFRGHWLLGVHSRQVVVGLHKAVSIVCNGSEKGGDYPSFVQKRGTLLPFLLRPYNKVINSPKMSEKGKKPQKMGNKCQK
jgi:hypothetical protein